jgi:hypothetical protein
VVIATPNTAPTWRKVLLMPGATAVSSGAMERMTAVVTVANAMAIPPPARRRHDEGVESYQKRGERTEDERPSLRRSQQVGSGADCRQY